MKKFFTVILIIFMLGLALFLYQKNNIVTEVDTEIEQEYQPNEENTINDTEVEFNEEENYNNLIEDYSKVFEEYDIEDIYSDEKLEKSYPLVDPSLIAHVKRYEENRLAYTLYDIDNNGINELILGVSDENYQYFTPTSIYAFNKDDKKVEKVFFMSTIERGSLEIYNNGIIFDSGSGGAALHYYEFGKIAENGYAYEKLESIEEEYLDEESAPIYRNSSTEEELEYTSFDEISDKYLSNSESIEFDKINKINQI